MPRLIAEIVEAQEREILADYLCGYVRLLRIPVDDQARVIAKLRKSSLASLRAIAEDGYLQGLVSRYATDRVEIKDVA